MAQELSGPLDPAMLAQVSDFLCLGNYCQRCLKEHLACPSVNEIITGVKFYSDDNDLNQDPPSYEEVMQQQGQPDQVFYKAI